VATILLIFLRVLTKKISVAPLLGGPRSSGAPVHWTAWTPGSYATGSSFGFVRDQQSLSFLFGTQVPVKPRCR